MKRILYFIICFGFLLLWSSCRKDFEFTPSTGNLEFSKDTVFLDTVFNNISSSTYNLRVYNRSDEDIVIPSIGLERGDASEYRLSVDGITGKSLSDIELLANDSLFIFVETTIDYTVFTNPDNEFLYTDKIQFDTGANLQDVDLVTLVKDAVFIFPDKDNTTGIIETLTLTIDGTPTETEIQGRELLPEELTFTNEKPYVIYGFAAVPGGEMLTINAGARVHFHANSGIVVGEGASLKVNGKLSTDPVALENEVIFEGDRLEPIFSDVPGQWGAIWLFSGSVNNTINYATIKNATAGLLVDGDPNIEYKLTLTNSQIYNSSAYGILGRNTSIKGENVVINNAGQIALAGTLGGKYNFTHSTIVNYWNNSFRQFPALFVNNYIIDEDNVATLADLAEASFSNCIIYGNDNPEFLVDEIEDPAVAFNFKFTNCLVRFDDENGTYDTDAKFDFNNTTLYENMIFNDAPKFRDTEKNDFVIGNESPANSMGNTTFATQVPTDILGIDRTTSPDIGAYQHEDF